MTPALWTALFAVIAALATFIGGVAVPDRLSRAQLSHLIAFGAGYILAAALMSLLPESLELIDNAHSRQHNGKIQLYSTSREKIQPLLRQRSCILPSE